MLSIKLFDNRKKVNIRQNLKSNNNKIFKRLDTRRFLHRKIIKWNFRYSWDES